jgi:Icc-related predicted phosphoesterase
MEPISSETVVKIAHFSDTHGLPRKGIPEQCDLVVHSGDLFPNQTRGVREVEISYQRQWLHRTMPHWRSWLQNIPMLMVAGNHDYIDPTPLMRAAGLRVYNVEGRILDMHGLRFMGLPDIPWMGGEWNHERSDTEMKEHVDLIYEFKPDVLIAHCPPYGVLDTPYEFNDGYHIGSTPLANALSYHPHEVKAVLCEHCHEQGGREARVRSTLISNAATTRRVVEI